MISVTLGQRPEVGFEEDRHEENKQTIHGYISSSSSVIFPFFFYFGNGSRWDEGKWQRST